MVSGKGSLVVVVGKAIDRCSEHAVPSCTSAAAFQLLVARCGWRYRASASPDRSGPGHRRSRLR